MNILILQLEVIIVNLLKAILKCLFSFKISKHYSKIQTMKHLIEIIQ